MEAKGVNGQASFDGHTLTITREGLLGRATQGRNTKTIPVTAIGSVQYRPPNMSSNGLWSIAVSGESQSTKPVRKLGQVAKAAREDENAIIVGPFQAKHFQALTDEINRARAGGHQQPAPAAPAPAVNTEREALIAQLRGIGEMHFRGTLTDAQFIAEAHRIIPKI